MTERKLGPNMRRLLACKVSRDAIPLGSGLAAAMNVIATPGRLLDLSRKGLIWVDAAIAAVRAAPDNPYGDDEEEIAGGILKFMNYELPSERET